MYSFRSRLTFLAVIALPFVAAAQPSPKPARFGVTGGLDLSTLGGENVSGLENKVGFSIGVLMQKPIDDTWAFQAEANFTGKGVKTTGGGSTGTLTLNYVEVPLLFRAYSTTPTLTRLFGEFGPALALKAGCTGSTTIGSTTISSSCSGALDIRSFDAGFMFGAGVEFPAGGRAVGLGIRYNLGLTEITPGAKSKNRNLQLLASVRFQ